MASRTQEKGREAQGRRELTQREKREKDDPERCWPSKRPDWGFYICASVTGHKRRVVYLLKACDKQVLV